MKRLVLALLPLTAVVSFLLGLVASGGRPSPTSGPVRHAAASVTPLDVVVQSATQAEPVATGAPTDFANIVPRLNGAVVSVDTISRDSEDGSRFVFPRRWSDQLREGSGSGFIIDPSGLILTNYHVIDDATRVTVTLRDGRNFRASVIGVDPAIDVALLKVSVEEKLPAAPLGKSSALRVGEWVCAIGNPLGYVHSVTVGVVSFLGRKVFDPSLDALIQTDAAITFGNSGGPLINAHGQVVGITAAISGQAANIGFAVPIDQVVAVLPQLRETGGVTRGYLGIGLTTLTPPLQRALHVGPDHGALVQDVPENTPAERAGVRAYDVILSADDHQVESDEELTRFIAARPPGATTSLQIWREGQMLTLPVKLIERPLPPSMRSTQNDSARVQPISRDAQLLGLNVTDLDAATLRRRNLPGTLAGVVITSVDPVGPARVTPLKAGQVLLEINRQRVTTVAQYRAIVATLRPGAMVAVLVYDPSSQQRLIQSIVTDSSS